MAISFLKVVPLALAMTGIVVAIAAQHSLERRPPWHTWLASLGVIGGFVAIIAAFIWVGRQLPN